MRNGFKIPRTLCCRDKTGLDKLQRMLAYSTAPKSLTLDRTYMFLTYREDINVYSRNSLK